MTADSRRILVVEDDEQLRGTMLDLLELEGFEVLSACNGREALECLRKNPAPSLIVLDLMMPVMSGPEFRAEQLRDGALSGIPVIVVSAASDGRWQAQAMGAVAYFAKPFAFEPFLDALRA